MTLLLVLMPEGVGVMGRDRVPPGALVVMEITASTSIVMSV